MEIWPGSQKQLQQIIVYLLLLLLLAVGLLFVLFQRFKDIAQSPLRPTAAGFPVEPKAPPCPQRVDESGWLVQDNQVRVFPRCLAIMNSRFGSRFNFDWHFSTQKATSSVLGTLEDKNAFFNIRVKEGNETESVFPLLANGSFSVQSVDLGLTYQKVNFENDDLLLTLMITSPFSPGRSAQDESNRMNTAPFFYLEFIVTNKTAVSQEKTVEISLGNARKIKTENYLETVYFNDPVRADGGRALASGSRSIQTGFIEGKQGGFYWPVSLGPRQSASTRLIYAGFLDGPVITDTTKSRKRKLKFVYRQWFEDIDEVIKYAVENLDQFEQKRKQFENRVQNRNLSPRIKWLLAQAFHSYLGNTWWVYDEEDKKDLRYYVWEGEFKYLNTLDVAHDYGVLEGMYFPWALKLALESWQSGAKQDEKGVVIPHDLGMRFYFNGSQAYGIEGSGSSGMPVEENANFVLLAYWYWQQTDDDIFIKSISGLVKELVESLAARDGNENGIADQLVRMTTYDNDGNTALKEGPDSAYLGLKQLAAYLSAEKIFEFTGERDSQNFAANQAKLIAGSLKKANEVYGFIPLSIDPDFVEKNQFAGQTIRGIDEQGFAFITGLFYPVLTGLKSPLLDDLIPVLADSYKQAYGKSLVKSPDGETIGFQLAEYQALHLGWFSHSVMADFIARKFFGQRYDSTQTYFPLLYDNPFSFADGQFFREPFYPPQTSLLFYPRGAALFALVGN